MRNTDKDQSGGAVEGEKNEEDEDPITQLIGTQADNQCQSEAIKAVIGNLSPLLTMALGLQSRGRV